MKTVVMATSVKRIFLGMDSISTSIAHHNHHLNYAWSEVLNLLKSSSKWLLYLFHHLKKGYNVSVSWGNKYILAWNRNIKKWHKSFSLSNFRYLITEKKMEMISNKTAYLQPQKIPIVKHISKNTKLSRGTNKKDAPTLRTLKHLTLKTTHKSTRIVCFRSR